MAEDLPLWVFLFDIYANLWAIWNELIGTLTSLRLLKFWEVMESHGVVTAQNCTDPVYSKGGPPCKGQDYASWWKYKCIKGIFF